MLEIGDAWAVLQIAAHLAGAIQIYCALWDGRLPMRKIAVQIASIISIATVMNYGMAGMLKGSHLGWLLICAMSIWNLYRVTHEELYRK
jgi:hypothetical protein